MFAKLTAATKITGGFFVADGFGSGFLLAIAQQPRLQLPRCTTICSPWSRTTAEARHEVGNFVKVPDVRLNFFPIPFRFWQKQPPRLLLGERKAKEHTTHGIAK